MFLIYGTRNGKKVMKFLVREICGSCGKVSDMTIVKTYTSATIFFIPIFSVNKKYFLICPHCGNIKQITKKEFKAIKEQAQNGQVVNLGGHNISDNQVQTNVEVVAPQKVEMQNQINKEIETIVNKLKEKNIAITKSNLQSVKDALKQRLMTKYQDEKLLEETINNFFKNFNI